MQSVRRVAAAAVLATAACAVLVGILLTLPGPLAVGCLFAGQVQFLVGAHLEWRWPVATGGIMMFSGVFAAALLGALD
jgi:hypothetical protein